MPALSRQASREVILSQNEKLAPSCSCRGGVCVPVMTPKAELFAVQQVVFGLLKCGVLNALNASAPIFSPICSPILIVLESRRSKFTYPGPQAFPATAFPNKGPVPLEKQLVLNHSSPLVEEAVFIWLMIDALLPQDEELKLARLVNPEFRPPLLAPPFVTTRGNPCWIFVMPLICQPPRTVSTAVGESDIQWRPRPNGSS